MDQYSLCIIADAALTLSHHPVLLFIQQTRPQDTLTPQSGAVTHLPPKGNSLFFFWQRNHSFRDDCAFGYLFKNRCMISSSCFKVTLLKKSHLKKKLVERDLNKKCISSYGLFAKAVRLIPKLNHLFLEAVMLFDISRAWGLWFLSDEVWIWNCFPPLASVTTALSLIAFATQANMSAFLERVSIPRLMWAGDHNNSKCAVATTQSLQHLKWVKCSLFMPVKSRERKSRGKCVFKKVNFVIKP